MFFDKQFVHCIWDESLVGKLCVFADDMPELKIRVERHDPHYTAVLKAPKCSMDMDTLAYPFYKDADAPTGYRFVYYDPNLQCKIAHAQGKQIQSRHRSLNDVWNDVSAPEWYSDFEYRVKPDKWFIHEMAGGKFYKDKSSDVYVEFEGTEAECDAWIAEHTPKTRRMTNKELAKWCADNKGQFSYANTGLCFAAYAYKNGDNTKVSKDVIIREWDSDEWHEPLVEVAE